jgi:hypothetical protein
MPHQLRQSSCCTATSAQPARRRPRRPPRTAHQLIEQHSWWEPLRRSPDNLKRLKEGLTLLLIWPPDLVQPAVVLVWAWQGRVGLMRGGTVRSENAGLRVPTIPAGAGP